MGKRVVMGTFVLVGIYLGVSHATAGGKLISAGATGASGFVKTLQGR